MDIKYNALARISNQDYSLKFLYAVGPTNKQYDLTGEVHRKHFFLSQNKKKTFATFYYHSLNTVHNNTSTENINLQPYNVPKLFMQYCFKFCK